MRRIMFVSFLVVCMTGVSYAQSRELERLYDRLVRLQDENIRLRDEVAQLRQQRSGCGPLPQRNRAQLSELRRQVDELQALRHSLDRLRR